MESPMGYLMYTSKFLERDVAPICPIAIFLNVAPMYMSITMLVLNEYAFDVDLFYAM